LLITAEKSLSSGLIVSASTIVPPSFLKASETEATRPWPYVFLSLMVAILVKPLPYAYAAATPPCTMSVVQVRKKPGYGRFGLARKSAPMVSDGPVLAGEIWAI